MAEAKKSPKSRMVARLTPASVDVLINGREIRVASNRAENTTLNAIMVSQGRDLIQRTIKAYEDMDETPDPRELRSLIGSMKDLVEASGIVYAPAEPVLNNEKKTEPTSEPEDIDFEGLHKPPEVKEDEPTRNPP
jgi:hypothetical protein